MLNIKKYADGRFFDTVSKKFIKPEMMEELVKKKEKIKVTLTKTGKDITDKVISEFSKKKAGGKKKAAGKKKKNLKPEIPFLNTESLKKWASEAIDKRITKVLDAVNLPSRDQVEKLDKNIRKLNKKIDALESLQAKAPRKKPAAAKKKPDAPRKKTVKKVETPVTETPEETIVKTGEVEVKPPEASEK